MSSEGLNYKPSTVVQAKFDYSLQIKFLIKRLKAEDKKEELLKKIKSIVEQSAFSAANKVSKAVNNESCCNYNSDFAFYRFYRPQIQIKILRQLRRDK